MDNLAACQRAYDRLMPEDVYGYPDYAKEDAIAEAEACVNRLREEAYHAFPGDWDPTDDDAGTDASAREIVIETVANWPHDLPAPDLDDLRYYASVIVQLRAAIEELDELR